MITLLSFINQLAVRKMKAAYFGYNALSSCLELLVNQGFEVVCVYTGKNSLHTDRIIKLSKQHQIPLFFDKPNQQQMNLLVSTGVNIFISAEYPWKIPVPNQLKFAINIPPTMLPDGRGPTPLPSLILTYPQHAGITLHKMTNKIDEGEILLQKQITLSRNESFDTLSAKLFVEVPQLLGKLLSNLEHYFKNSSRQKYGTYWEKLSLEEQTICWDKTTSKILHQLRAFGSLGVYSKIQGQNYLITSAEGVTYEHNIKSGEVVSVDELRLVIASSDGVISIPQCCITRL